MIKESCFNYNDFGFSLDEHLVMVFEHCYSLLDEDFKNSIKHILFKYAINFINNNLKQNSIEEFYELACERHYLNFGKYDINKESCKEEILFDIYNLKQIHITRFVRNVFDYCIWYDQSATLKFCDWIDLNQKICTEFNQLFK